MMVVVGVVGDEVGWLFVGAFELDCDGVGCYDVGCDGMEEC